MAKGVVIDYRPQKKMMRLSKSCLSEAEKSAVMGVLDREFLGMGAEVEQFEEALSNFFGRPAVNVINGTAALHLALQACGVGHGDEVLVPSLTYVASFQAISAVGAIPVACDVDLKTLTLDWRDAEMRQTSRTKAIMPVHYAGGLGDLDAIYSYAHSNDLRVIEDAAHAFGSTYHGRRVGSFGDIACFSFDGIKNITSGEGGCVVTDDEAILEHVRDARLLGVKNDTIKRYANQRSWDFDVTEQGWRYHMSDLMAAIGINQLQRFPEMAVMRQNLAVFYDACLKEHARIEYFRHDYGAIVPHIYVVRIHGLKDREALRKHLLEQSIQTGVHFQPNHMLTYYRDDAITPLVVTEKVSSELLSLPLHPDVTEHDIRYICEQLMTALD
jgi:dTDP-4-amino-4,6-dideoxygalactose transaminase